MLLLTTYSIFLYIHSWLRWIVLILSILVTIRALVGWFGKKSFTGGEAKTSVFLVASAHLQALLGLILYLFLSPYTKTAFKDFGAAMKNSSLRFWAVEHILMMFLAITFIQLGRTFSKKASTDIQKHKKLAIFTSLALICILAGIPWHLIPLFR